MLHNNGLTKLSEECGELVQAIAKFTTFKDECPDKDIHWDGKSVSKSLEDEIADVIAATVVVTEIFRLDLGRIIDRQLYKKALFEYWHKGGTDTSIPWPPDSPVLDGEGEADA